jgi:23S rRNA pseudouridine2604 synthase
MEFPMRLNKYLAHKGYATRRDADVLIERGDVLVNGKPATLGQKVTETDKVEVKGRSQEKHRYILYYKPFGVATNASSPDEIDIVTYVKKKNSITGLFPIGRLDKDSEGLIVLTNDGRITSRLLNQEDPLEQEYEVTVDKRVTQTFLNRLEKGVRIGGYMTQPTRASLHDGNEKVFTIALTESKKYHIRRMCATLGYSVQSLKRTRIDKLSLKRLKPGAFHELKGLEAKAFQRALGLQ